MAFPTTALDVQVSLALGADLADPGSWTWTDITTYVRVSERIRIRRGRSGERDTMPPSRCTLTVDNSDGRFCRLLPTGAWYGQIGKNTPLRVRINNGSGYVTRFIGYVSEWPPTWDPSGADQTVSLSADGILRRLGNANAVKSVLYRTMIGVAPGDYVPYVYWPAEEGSDATQIASGLPGGQPMTSSKLTFAAATDLVSSAALPTIAAGGHALAIIPAYTNTLQWVNQWVMRMPSSAPAAETLLWQVTTVSPERAYRFSVSPSTNSLVLRTFTGGVQESIVTVPLDGTAGPSATSANFYGKWFLCGLSSSPFGGSIATEVKLYDVYGDEFLPTTPLGQIVATTTTGRATTAGIPIADTGLDGVGFGHNALYTDTNFNIASDQANNALGLIAHAGEMAHDRGLRLGVEEGIPISTAATTSQQMGPQGALKLVKLLADIATTDWGLVYEGLDGGLTVLSSSERYNLTAAITLTYTSGHIAPPWQPADDDRGFFNDVTANRPDGSSSRQADEDSIAAVGSYQTSIDTNTYTDEQLANVAGFGLSLGLIDELRWPTLQLNLRANPSLINAWMAADLGDVLAVTGHPSPLAPDTIRQIIEGYSETLGPYEYSVSINLSPASGWDALVLDTDRLDSGSSTLNSSITSTGTTVSVATSDSTELWSTTAEPYNIRLGGEVMTATNVTGASSPQSFTSTTRSVNGVVKAHTSGAIVLADPPRLGL